MNIQKGTVWHTYTMQCPNIKLSRRMIKDVMHSRIFLSAFDYTKNLYYFDGDRLKKSRLDFQFNTDVTGLKVTGLPFDKKHAACDFTLYSTHILINKILSQNKILQADGTFYSDYVFFALKPFFLGSDDNQKIIIPVISIYENGIAQVNFIDLNDYSNTLNEFIRDNVNYPFTRPHSIICPIEYAVTYLSFDNKISPLFRRLLDYRYYREVKRTLLNNSEPLEYGERSLNGNYVDYMKFSNVKHGLGDIARTIVALVYSHIIKISPREFLLGLDVNKYYSGWQGKPNIFILEHDNQKTKSSLNWLANKRMINALLSKTMGLYQDNIPLRYEDYRMFDDFNYFSAQGVSLSMLTSKSLKQLNLSSGFTVDNFKWDNLVKSDLREIVSFFYEGTIYKINNINKNIELAQIKKEIFEFEEWLRQTSRRSGEIHNYALSLFEHNDIKQSRKSIDSLIKSKMELIKIQETESSDKANKNLTLIFGLIATTSISPILVKPAFEYFKLDDCLRGTVFYDFIDAIYFVISISLVYLLIKILNKK
ncbi:hypothetical protein [Pantoea agglomerans]|uniref:Uncharacterized protein n=1 Tax=Enterobacter agglomerans TaxID=549 RepID=A0AAN2FDH5_ENTAG|nr:hypothetical protein [Pantoea agglomerans]CAH6303988.1 hypothetical protein DAPPPG734_12990 [Pantoea agglomerans]